MVRTLSPIQIERLRVEFERALDRTPEIDRWCSGLDWVLSVHEGFGASSVPLILASDGHEPGFALLARYQLADRRVVIGGLEPLWGFASPLVGAHIEALTAGVVDHLATLWWDEIVLPGMPRLTGPDCFTARVAGALTRLGRVGLANGIVRQVADIGDGHDAWWARRSSRFRRNLSRAERQADQAGVEFVDVSGDHGVFERLMAIEASSWKGREESGMTSPDMARTYQAMVGRLQRQARLRAMVARAEGVDIGYILGGVRAGVYRGLQLSYAEGATGLSVGHLLQHHQLRALCRSGEAHTYDLGMDLDYKQRWADTALPTFTLVVSR